MDDCTTERLGELRVATSRPSTEIELIHRSQAGDTEAFGELVTRYRTKIFNTIYGMVGNENDAWDLAQEGFLKAGNRSAVFKVDPLSIRGCTGSR